MGRPAEHWHSGAGPCLECTPAASSALGASGPAGDGWGAVAFRKVLEERWPRREGEPEDEWMARVYPLFAAGLMDPRPLRYPRAEIRVEPLDVEPPGEAGG